MSQASDAQPNVLTASVNDVRYLTALLRGVNFVNRANVTITSQGLTITVEEARTLLGMAFVFASVFDEFEYHPEPRSSTQRTGGKGKNRADSDEELDQEEPEPEDDNVALEIPLNTLIECLNIFGTATGSTTMGSEGTKGKRWKKDGDSDQEGEDGNGRGRLDAYFSGGSEKRTGMRLTYPGPGYPLRLIIAEDASGPTMTCEIATYDPEPQLELDFDASKTVLKIILKSSWLRDALSELDPSCEKLTFIGNPPNSTNGVVNDSATGRPKQKQPLKPTLRIRAAGSFGTTEMDYPNDRDVLETFECMTNVSFSYRFGHIGRTLRALQNSTKTSLRIDEDGLLSLQFLMPSSKPRAGVKAGEAFIEFRCLPLDETI